MDALALRSRRLSGRILFDEGKEVTDISEVEDGIALKKRRVGKHKQKFQRRVSHPSSNSETRSQQPHDVVSTQQEGNPIVCVPAAVTGEGDITPTASVRCVVSQVADTSQIADAQRVYSAASSASIGQACAGTEWFCARRFAALHRDSDTKENISFMVAGCKVRVSRGGRSLSTRLHTAQHRIHILTSHILDSRSCSSSREANRLPILDDVANRQRAKLPHNYPVRKEWTVRLAE
jgi:hypothetical protein